MIPVCVSKTSRLLRPQAAFPSTNLRTFLRSLTIREKHIFKNYSSVNETTKKNIPSPFEINAKNSVFQPTKNNNSLYQSKKDSTKNHNHDFFFNSRLQGSLQLRLLRWHLMRLRLRWLLPNAGLFDHRSTTRSVPTRELFIVCAWRARMDGNSGKTLLPRLGLLKSRLVG